MGRSVMTYPRAQAVAFIDATDVEDFFEFDWLVGDIQDTITSTWKSMETADRWEGNELHVIAENELAFVTISEYCGLVALCLVSKSEEYQNSWYADEIRKANLADHWTAQVAPKFSKTFGQLQSLGFASNGEQFFQRVN